MAVKISIVVFTLCSLVAGCRRLEGKFTAISMIFCAVSDVEDRDPQLNNYYVF
jgi:hypothetical protein